MVDLQPHSPAWADDYRREAARLAVALGPRVDAFEHVGSTAVPDLVAKPIIDVADQFWKRDLDGGLSPVTA